MAESVEFFEFIQKELALLIEHWNTYRAGKDRPAD
jgi:hypothetical protein